MDGVTASAQDQDGVDLRGSGGQAWRLGGQAGGEGGECFGDGAFVYIQ
jgi:hypothetical protein